MGGKIAGVKNGMDQGIQTTGNPPANRFLEDESGGWNFRFGVAVES